jgi:WD repeat-containing protein 48
VVVIGYSDDSMVLHDIRSGYKDKIRLEVGNHTDTVKTIKFSENDGDFLCLTGGSDCMLKLWDLRQRKCIRDYGGNDGDVPAIDWGLFHYDSVWTIEPNTSFESCYSGGRDGQIYHTDMVEESNTLIYQGNKNPITNLKLDEINNKLWFTSTKDSSLRCMDLNKAYLNKTPKHLEGVGNQEQAAPT